MALVLIIISKSSHMLVNVLLANSPYFLFGTCLVIQI